jgi:hypothetical protein
LGIVLSLVIGGRASAAPQILGLVATETPTPLTCSDGLCTAQLSAFCLQQYRTSPRAGTPYQPAEGSDVALRFTGPGGAQHVLPANNRVTITSTRGHYAVLVSIPEDDIRVFGGRNAAISVGAMASLVPVAQPGDKTPLDEKEITYITGPHRKAVQNALDPDANLAAQTVSRLISALPRGRTTAERRNRIWREVMGEASSPSLNAGHRLAYDDYRYCKRWADTGRGYGLRDCLQEMHDHTATGITEKAWSVSTPGS